MPYRGPIRGVDLSALRPKPSPVVAYDPFSDPYQPIEGQSWLELLNLGSQALGSTGFTRTVPGDVWEQPVSLWINYTADANVANRTPNVQMRTPDGNTFATIDSDFSLTANQQGLYMWQPGNPWHQQTNAGIRAQNMPEIILPPSFLMVFRFTGAQVGDHAQFMFMQVRRWRNHPARIARDRARQASY